MYKADAPNIGFLVARLQIYIQMTNVQVRRDAVPRQRKGRLVAYQGARLEMLGVPCTRREAWQEWGNLTAAKQHASLVLRLKKIDTPMYIHITRKKKGSTMSILVRSSAT